ncbi:MAG TPA: glycerophosphodiester phosphodiesterase [Candidatus Saccharimonadales bacterium]|nr:glycerophosphodiester phosphodiesterase [Candidatus Saccharimonadales bacterium]
MPKGFWDSRGPIAIAHRGGDGAGKDKENTPAAFQTAHQLGYKYAEIDVIKAASGELAVVHGTYNWFQAGVSRGISSRVLQTMTFDQICNLIRPGGQPYVPTVEEILTGFPKLKFVIDVKTDEVVLPLVRLLKRLDAFGRVIISDNDYPRCLKLIRACGRQQASVSVGLTVGRGLPFRNINIFLLKSGRLKGIDTIFLHHSLVSAPMISLIHHRGFKAVVWTANSSLGIKHALRSGADGVTSDRVELLKELIESRQSHIP